MEIKEKLIYAKGNRDKVTQKVFRIKTRTNITPARPRCHAVHL